MIRILRRGPPPSFFLSYRRKDAGGHAAALDSVATRRYGRRRVFRDVESIEGGDDWRDRLDAELSRAAVVVAVIGPGWAGAGAPGIESRIMADDDPVRYELRTAARRDVPIVPVLIGDTAVPPPDTLPEDLRWLPDRQGVPVIAGQERAGHARVLRVTDASLGWWARRLHRAATGGLAALVLLGGTTAAVLRPRPELPTVGIGESALLLVPPALRAADVEPARSPAAAAFIAELAAALLKATPAGTTRTITVADPAFTLTTNGARREADIRTLLARSGADLLLTGTLAVSPTSSTFTPEVYLGSLLDVEELAGRRIDVDTGALRGLDVDITQVDGASRELADQAARSLSGLNALLDAAAAYQRRDLERADGLLGTLLDHGVIRDTGGIVVLRQLRANALTELGRLDEAAKDYRTALAADPTFERSALGLAELELLRGGGSRCALTADAERLADAQRQYTAIRDQTTVSTIRAKAIVGAARVDSCRVQAYRDVDGVWRPAAANAYRSLDEVLGNTPDAGGTGASAAEGAERSLAETLALARLTRAQLTADLAAVPGAGRSLTQAVTDFRAVSGLTRRPWVKAQAQLALADLLAQRPELGSAEQARRAACAALQRTLDLGPGTAIEDQTRRRMQRVTAAGVPCAPAAS